MFLKNSLIIWALAFGVGCAPVLSGESLILTEGKSLTNMQLIDGDNFHKVRFVPGISGLDKLKEDDIRNRCDGPKKEPERMFVPLTFLIGPAIDFVLDGIDKAIKSELGQYIAAYSGSTEEKFYKSTNTDGPIPSWTCFRFSRAVAQKDQDHVVLDLIGQIALTPEKDALKIRPLRLYFAQAKAKGGQIGVSMSLTADAVWRQHNRGLSERIFDHKFLSEKIDVSAGRPVVMYYLDSEWDDHARLPLIPWSTNQEGNMKAGDVSLTVTVAEVGMPPRLLELAANLFAKNKGDLAKLMKDSADKLLSEKKTK